MYLKMIHSDFNFVVKNIKTNLILKLIARTRLQMAFADMVYVVECEKESGTMHAVNFALKYGKPIYALDCDWSGNSCLIDNGLAKPFK